MAESEQQKFAQLLETIAKFGDDKRDPPAAKRLEGDHILALMKFVDSQNTELLTQCITTLGDAARIATNRDYIGGTKPMGKFYLIFQKAIEDKNTLLIQMMLRLLGNLCFDHPFNREELRTNQCVPLILVCLKQSDQETQRVASGCIANMASATEEICADIFQLGGIDTLLNLLTSDNFNVRCMAARALRNLGETDEIMKYFADNGLLDRAIKVVISPDSDYNMVIEFLGLVNSLISYDPLCDDFIGKYNGITILLDVLTNSDKTNLTTTVQDFLFELSENEKTKTCFVPHRDRIRNLFFNTANKIEIRICSGKLYSTISYEDNLLPQFYGELNVYLTLLNDSEKEIQCIAATLIGSLARNEKNCTDMVSNGIGQILIDLIADEERDLRVRHYCTSTLRNLSINEKNKHVLIKGGIMPPLVKLLQQSKLNQVVVYQAVGVIKNLISGGDEFIKIFLDAGGLEHMVALINFDESEHLKFESCRVIALLFNRAIFMHDKLISSGALPALGSLLGSKFELLKTESLQALHALIQSGHSTSIALQPSLLKSLLSLLESPTFPEELQNHFFSLLQIMTDIPLLSKALALQNASELLKKHTPSPAISLLLQKLESTQHKNFPELEKTNN